MSLHPLGEGHTTSPSPVRRQAAPPAAQCQTRPASLAASGDWNSLIASHYSQTFFFPRLRNDCGHRRPGSTRGSTVKFLRRNALEFAKNLIRYCFAIAKHFVCFYYKQIPSQCKKLAKDFICNNTNKMLCTLPSSSLLQSRCSPSGSRESIESGTDRHRQSTGVG